MSKRIEETMIYPFGEFSFGIRIKYNYDGKPTISADHTPASTMPISTTPTIILPEELEDYSRLPKGRRARTVFSSKQLKTLERKFQKNSYLTSEQIKELADRTELTEKQVRDWFRNHRMRKRMNGGNLRQDEENAERQVKNSLNATSSQYNGSDYFSSEEEEAQEEESKALEMQNSHDRIKVVSIVKETAEDEDVPIRVYGKGIQLASDEIPLVGYNEVEERKKQPVATVVFNEAASPHTSFNEEVTVSDIFDFLEGFSGSPLDFSEAERKILTGKAENELIQSKSDAIQPRQNVKLYEYQKLSKPYSAAAQVPGADVLKQRVKETPVAHIEPLAQLKWQTNNKQQMPILPAATKKPKIEILEQIIFCPIHLQMQPNCYVYLENVEQSIKNRTKVIWF